MMTSDKLNEMARKAETGEQWAEICRLEAEMLSDRRPVSGPVHEAPETAPNKGETSVRDERANP